MRTFHSKSATFPVQNAYKREGAGLGGTGDWERDIKH